LVAVTVSVEEDPLVIVEGVAVMFTVAWTVETVTIAVAAEFPLLFVAVAV
jgi:hypothetical protein